MPLLVWPLSAQSQAQSIDDNNVMSNLHVSLSILRIKTQSAGKLCPDREMLQACMDAPMGMGAEQYRLQLLCKTRTWQGLDALLAKMKLSASETKSRETFMGQAVAGN